MLYRNRCWYLAAICALAGAGLLSGCQSGDESTDRSAAAEVSETLQQAASSRPSAQAASGAGEQRPALDLQQVLSTDDLAFLSQLDLINGHLLVGMQLLDQAQADAAKTHMKHPGDELYRQLEEAFTSRDLPGFAAELQALNAAVNDAADAQQAYLDLQQAIASHAAAIDNAASDGILLQRVTRLLRTAADEYALGVVGGKVSNAHEYQDAWGFTEYAKQLLQALADGDAQKRALALLNDLRPLWPGLMPPPQISGDAAKIYGAAARMEFLASGLSD